MVLRYDAWYEEHRRYIAPSEWAISLPYDAKANPERYLANSFYMNNVLEKWSAKCSNHSVSLRH